MDSLQQGTRQGKPAREHWKLLLNFLRRHGLAISEVARCYGPNGCSRVWISDLVHGHRSASWLVFDAVAAAARSALSKRQAPAGQEASP